MTVTANFDNAQTIRAHFWTLLAVPFISVRDRGLFVLPGIVLTVAVFLGVLGSSRSSPLMYTSILCGRKQGRK